MIAQSTCDTYCCYPGGSYARIGQHCTEQRVSGGDDRTKNQKVGSRFFFQVVRMYSVILSRKWSVFLTGGVEQAVSGENSLETLVQAPNRALHGLFEMSKQSCDRIHESSCQLVIEMHRFLQYAP